MCNGNISFMPKNFFFLIFLFQFDLDNPIMFKNSKMIKTNFLTAKRTIHFLISNLVHSIFSFQRFSGFQVFRSHYQVCIPSFGFLISLLLLAGSPYALPFLLGMVYFLPCLLWSRLYLIWSRIVEFRPYTRYMLLLVP